MTDARAADPPAALPAYLDMSVDHFLREVASGRAAPGGGSAAATSVALGAGLSAMAARLSTRQLTYEHADELAAEAERLRIAAAALIQADAEAFQSAVAATRNNSQAGAQPLTDGLAQAAAVPLKIIEIAARVAHIAARLAAEGNPNLRGDAVTGLLLSDAGARAALELVHINLADVREDHRGRHARDLCTAIADIVAATVADSGSAVRNQLK